MADHVQKVLQVLHTSDKELSADDIARKMRHVLCPRWLPGVLEYLVRTGLAVRIERNITLYRSVIVKKG